MKEIIKMQVQEFVAVSIARGSSFSVWRWLDECAFLALTTTQIVQEASHLQSVYIIFKSLHNQSHA
jgi:hypothetical protein